MLYTKQLPNLSKLRQLAKHVAVFPASAQQFFDTAERSGCNQDILSFLRFFHPDETFSNDLDFITRCEELELLLNQERQSPYEVVRSPEC